MSRLERAELAGYRAEDARRRAEERADKERRHKEIRSDLQMGVQTLLRQDTPTCTPAQPSNPDGTTAPTASKTTEATSQDKERK